MKSIFQISLYIAIFLLPIMLVAQNPQYQWSNGATTATIDVSPAQATTYYVTVTDGSTTFVDSVTIAVTTINVTNTTTNVSTCGATDGSVTLSVTNGNAPYTYNWSNSATTQNLSNVGIGGYTVTVTDANNCTASATAAVNAPSGSVLPTSNFTNTQTNNSVAFKNLAINYTSYLWNFGDGTTNSADLNATHTYTTSGNYEACLYTFNSCGSDTMCVTISVVTSVAEIGKNIFNIFPNPTTGKITLTLSEAGSYNINIYNSIGQQVYNGTMQHASQQVIDLGNAAKGIYYVQLGNGKENISRTIIVE